MYKVLIIILLLVSGLAAQNPLTLEEAISIGLQNNYSIQIARNSAQVSQNNQGLGLSGFLPTLNANGNYQMQNSREKSNSQQSYGDSETEIRSAELALQWTLFDGFRMFANRKLYSESARLGHYQARQSIENTVVAICRAYFNLVLQEKLLQIAEESKQISEERFNQEKVRHEIGGASSTDLLNAQVAYNTDRSKLLSQELEVEIARENLNLLLGREPSEKLNVVDDIVIPELKSSEAEIKSSANQNNSGINIARKNKQVASQQVSLARSAFFPRLNLSAGYGYNDRTIRPDQATFANEINTESYTGSIGLNLSFNLFNGRRDKISYQNARLQKTNSSFALAEAENQLSGKISQTYETYQRRVQIVTLEEQNVTAARQNLELIQDRYQLGASTSLEFRDAQVNLFNAQVSLISAKYQARISRIEIDQLTGMLAIE